MGDTAIEPNNPMRFKKKKKILRRLLPRQATALFAQRAFSLAFQSFRQLTVVVLGILQVALLLVLAS